MIKLVSKKIISFFLVLSIVFDIFFVMSNFVFAADEDSVRESKFNDFSLTSTHINFNGYSVPRFIDFNYSSGKALEYDYYAYLYDSQTNLVFMVNGKIKSILNNVIYGDLSGSFSVFDCNTNFAFYGTELYWYYNIINLYKLSSAYQSGYCFEYHDRNVVNPYDTTNSSYSSTLNLFNFINFNESDYDLNFNSISVIYANYDISGFYTMSEDLNAPDSIFSYQYIYYRKGYGFIFVDSASPVLKFPVSGYDMYFDSSCNRLVYVSADGSSWRSLIPDVRYMFDYKFTSSSDIYRSVAEDPILISYSSSGESVGSSLPDFNDFDDIDSLDITQPIVFSKDELSRYNFIPLYFEQSSYTVLLKDNPSEGEYYDESTYRVVYPLYHISDLDFLSFDYLYRYKISFGSDNGGAFYLDTYAYSPVFYSESNYPASSIPFFFDDVKNGSGFSVGVNVGNFSFGYDDSGSTVSFESTQAGIRFISVERVPTLPFYFKTINNDLSVLNKNLDSGFKDVYNALNGIYGSVDQIKNFKSTLKDQLQQLKDVNKNIVAQGLKFDTFNTYLSDIKGSILDICNSDLPGISNSLDTLNTTLSSIKNYVISQDNILKEVSNSLSNLDSFNSKLTSILYKNNDIYELLSRSLVFSEDGFYLTIPEILVMIQDELGSLSFDSPFVLAPLLNDIKDSIDNLELGDFNISASGDLNFDDSRIVQKLNQILNDFDDSLNSYEDTSSGTVIAFVTDGIDELVSGTVISNILDLDPGILSGISYINSLVVRFYDASGPLKPVVVMGLGFTVVNVVLRRESAS